MVEWWEGDSERNNAGFDWTDNNIACGKRTNLTCAAAAAAACECERVGLGEVRSDGVMGSSSRIAQLIDQGSSNPANKPAI